MTRDTTYLPIDQNRKVRAQKTKNYVQNKRKEEQMGFPISAGLLDAMVLSVVDSGDTYGYEITRYLRGAVDVSESTLYPVLRRLQKAGQLEAYDKEFMGRNRRYYRITEQGRAALLEALAEWKSYKLKIDNILTGEEIKE